MVENICVVNPAKARYLVRHGAIIVDIKPNRQQPLSSVFFFAASTENTNLMNEYDSLFGIKRENN